MSSRGNLAMVPGPLIFIGAYLVWKAVLLTSTFTPFTPFVSFIDMAGFLETRAGSEEENAFLNLSALPLLASTLLLAFLSFRARSSAGRLGSLSAYVLYAIVLQLLAHFHLFKSAGGLMNDAEFKFSNLVCLGLLGLGMLVVLNKSSTSDYQIAIRGAPEHGSITLLDVLKIGHFKLLILSCFFRLCCSRAAVRRFLFVLALVVYLCAFVVLIQKFLMDVFTGDRYIEHSAYWDATELSRSHLHWDMFWWGVIPAWILYSVSNEDRKTNRIMCGLLGILVLCVELFSRLSSQDQSSTINEAWIWFRAENITLRVILVLASLYGLFTSDENHRYVTKARSLYNQVEEAAESASQRCI
mmetsp:Transcript_38371/g.85678  ORF Transcript_38371/g.85678 Transcript_38371/m.85678 type:complete len:356 (-) Transcript_38371:284-1351(-)